MPRTSVIRLLLCLLGLVWTWAPAAARATGSTPSAPASPWWSLDPDGAVRVHLYFFWTETCPHCQRARPFVKELAADRPWLSLHSMELTRDAESAREFARLARSVGEEPRAVPAFLFCGRMLVGFDAAEGAGARLRSELESCRMGARSEGPVVTPPPPSGQAVDSAARLPGLGDVDLGRWSLPLVAVTLGGLDAFNPCAFFVLLFLLSLLVNARSRRRMLLIGALFVGTSGSVYFLFLAAWLNVFLWVGELAWVTRAAGLLALAIGSLKIADFFRIGGGPTLGIPEAAKPGLFRRMRGLVTADRLPVLVVGTLLLAVVANAYELLCTAGFPLVFTRILTLQDLPLGRYYAYLALYCGVYVLPLLAIVGAFALTLGRRKLTEREGRVLELLSGVMMAGLGIVLLLDPSLLGKVAAPLGLVAAALATTFIVTRWTSPART